MMAWEAVAAMAGVAMLVWVAFVAGKEVGRQEGWRAGWRLAVRNYERMIEEARRRRVEGQKR